MSTQGRKPRAKKIAVGDTWKALCTSFSMPRESGLKYWYFTVVAVIERKEDGKRLFFAVKCGLEVNTDFTHVFDEYGEECGDSGFYFVRKIRPHEVWFAGPGFWLGDKGKPWDKSRDRWRVATT